MTHSADYHYAESRDYLNVKLGVIMLNATMLGLIMLNVMMLSVIILSVIMLNVITLSVVMRVS